MNKWPLSSLFLSFLILLQSSCTKVSKNSSNFDLQRRKVEEYFVSSGVVRYFLPEIPYWANFSESASCRRNVSIKYLDLNTVRGSLALSYEQAIQLQLMLNDMFTDLKKRQVVEHIPFQEEESLFFKANDRIQAGIRLFRVPSFKRVHLIWIDSLLENRAKLKALMETPLISKGHPVFLSLCYTRSELESWIQKSGFNNQNIRLLSYEMLSPYNLEGKLDTRFHIFVDEIFGKDKIIKLFIPKNKAPPKVLEGKFKVSKF